MADEFDWNIEIIQFHVLICAYLQIKHFFFKLFSSRVVIFYIICDIMHDIETSYVFVCT